MKKSFSFLFAIMISIFAFTSSVAASTNPFEEYPEVNNPYITEPPAPVSLVEKHIDLGTHQIYTNIQGKAFENRPTVVFEAGFGHDSTAWRYVQPVIAQRTLTVSYDRSSLGKSDATPIGSSRDAVGIATELHQILEALQVPKPYILVGHSMGGNYVRVFQGLYPDEVAGIVSVDGTVDTFEKDILLPYFDHDFLFNEYIPASDAGQEIGLGDYEDMIYSNAQAYGFRPSLADLPLFVLSSQKQMMPYSQMDEAIAEYIDLDRIDLRWHELQAELAAESTKGTFLIAKDSAHEINLYRPDIVISAISQILDQVI